MDNEIFHQVAFSKNLCDLTILTFGDLDEVDNDLNCPGGDEKNDKQKETCRYEGSKDGLHCLLFDTSIFHKRYVIFKCPRLFI